MIIRRSAIRAFINRPRRDFNEYKNRSLKWLQRRVDALPRRPPIWKRLRKEQRVGFVAGVEMKKFCFWYDMGMGKTLLAVALSRYFRRVKKVRRVLVLIPNKVNKYEWASDVRKHSPKTRLTILRGSTRHKWKQLEAGDSLFVLETYGGLVRMLCKPKKRKNKKGRRLVPHLPSVKRMLKQVQGIVMDESIMVQKKKRHGSLIFRLCRKLANLCDIAFALNGTPFGRDPTDMWGQMYVIDEGETLGETLGLFRAALFKQTKNFWGGYDYKFDKKKEKLLHQIIGNRSIRYEAEAGDLPVVIDIVKKVRLPTGASEYYEKAKQAVIASRGNFKEQKNAFLRMRQISSGFVGYDDDELGVRCRYTFDYIPKLERLISMIQEVQHAHKIVVFHEFTFSGDLIAARLKRLKIDHVRMYGKTKEHDAITTRFATNPKCRVFLLQNSMGYGLDRIKIAKYGIYYESPVGTVMRKQTRRRIERQHSTHNKVFICDLVVRNTVDQQILDAHQEGMDLFQAIVEGRKRPI